MRCILTILVALLAFTGVYGDTALSEIKFDTTVHNFGTFPESKSVVTCKFTFTNVGNAPLIINQAIASCGCTVPSYTEKPIAPGAKGEISVTYNGKGRYPGYFKKIITTRSNAKTHLVRLYIEGNMTEDAQK